MERAVKRFFCIAVLIGAACSGAGPSGTEDGGAIDSGAGSIDTDGGGVTQDGTRIDAGACAGCFALIQGHDPSCQAGTTDQICGHGGLACYTCINGAHCISGRCQLPCGPDTCGSGCCDASGSCRTTDRDAATCGAGGASCAACPGGQTCASGACVDQTCNASCTTGCCDGTTCEPGTANAKCGKSGNACFACPAGQTCDATSQACLANPNALWKIEVLNATVSATDVNNAPWDSFGTLPDPFVRIAFSTFDSTTETIDDTITPVWNATLFENVPTASLVGKLFTMIVYDDDVGPINDTIDGCYATLTQADLARGDYQAICLSGNIEMSRLNLRFTVQ